MKTRLLPNLLLISLACNPKPNQEAINFKLRPVALTEVTLLDGPFKAAMEADQKWLLALSPDRLLHRFRANAGLEPKGPVYGGWESRGISGHSLGHYLSACAMMYGATGDEVFKERVDYLVDELAECQKARRTGYVGAIPKEDSTWQVIASGNIQSQGFDLNGLWVPWYTQHKLLAGLLDAQLYTGSTEALQIATDFADWIDRTFAGLTHEQWQQMLACEFGGMPESLAELYHRTGEERYLALAQKFHHEAVLDPLAAQRDELAGKHANTQVPKIIGAARKYELTGEAKDSTIAAYFLRKVLADHSYANGGNSEHEHFGQPGHLANRLSEATSETCNTYNMIKLARHVNGWEFDGRWGDYVERAMLNHILASQNPKNGMVCYFMPLGMGGEKTYSEPFDSFWCCVGSGWENHAKYGALVYFTTAENALVIDQFIASELKTEGWELRMNTELPQTGQIDLTIVEAPADKALFLRQPQWATDTRIELNGKPINATNEQGYLRLEHAWQKGDLISVSFGMELHQEAMPDDPNKVALFYGPTLLAATLPDSTNPLDFPVFLAENQPAQEWVNWQTSAFQGTTDQVGRPFDPVLKPYYQITEGQYAVYLDLYDKASWNAYRAEIEAEKAARLALEARTLDVMRIGEMQPERDHHLQGENTESGEAFNRKWRHAVDGWFSFTMAVDPNQPNELQTTYWGGDAGNREFEILIDGTTIATQKLERNRPDEFYEAYYPIPRSLTKGNTEVTVRFQALPGKTAGGLYGVRMLRAE